jgi:DNA polymerase III subunit delta'
VPGFETLIDQDRPIRILSTFLQKGIIPHALLFTGIEGVGKENAAVIFAKAVNCEAKGEASNPDNGAPRRGRGFETTVRSRAAKPCDSCKSCRKIDSDNHPDVIRVKPSGPFIKIGQIRDLCQTLAMRPYEARIRVVIIAEAEAMNPAAGNALLKILEEPPAGTILILVAAQTSDLLPTIVSRCQLLRFNPISRKSLKAELVQRVGVEPAQATIIASMARGSFSRALALYRTNWIRRRNWLFAELNALSAENSGRLLALSEELARDKDALPEALEVMASWFHDMIIARYDPEKLINPDLADTVQQTSPKRNMAELLAKLEAIQSTRYALQAGTNLRLAMEAMLLKLGATF